MAMSFVMVTQYALMFATSTKSDLGDANSRAKSAASQGS
jgi:hypothetical protein